MEVLVYDEVTNTWMSQQALEELKVLREKTKQKAEEDK